MSQTRRATPIRRVSLSMKVPTLLFGTQLSQTPDSGREAALKLSTKLKFILYDDDTNILYESNVSSKFLYFVGKVFDENTGKVSTRVNGWQYLRWMSI